MLPSAGRQEISWMKLRAVRKVATAARPSEISRAEPARPAATPVTAKMPAPTVAPMLMAEAEKRLRLGLIPGFILIPVE